MKAMSRRQKNKRKRKEQRFVDRRKAKLDKEPPNITENGRRIRRFMIEHRVKGHYKDYVIIIGTTLIDYHGSLPVPSTFEGAVLVHKRKLKNILNPEVAAKFWHPRLGRVGAVIKPATKKNLH